MACVIKVLTCVIKVLTCDIKVLTCVIKVLTCVDVLNEVLTDKRVVRGSVAFSI